MTDCLPKWVESAKNKDKIISLMQERHKTVEAFSKRLLSKRKARKRVFKITREIRRLYDDGQ